jgi:hypothetical protein
MNKEILDGLKMDEYELKLLAGRCLEHREGWLRAKSDLLDIGRARRGTENYEHLFKRKCKVPDKTYCSVDSQNSY